MKPHLFDMPNKRVVTVTEPGATADSFYSGPAPASEEVTVGVSIGEVAPTLYCTLTDHSFYSTCSVVINMLNDATPVQRTIVWDLWNGEGQQHSKFELDVGFDQVVNFEAMYTGFDFYEGEGDVPADIKIQAKSSLGEFIETEAVPVTTVTKFPCYFVEATTKSDLVSFDSVGAAVENLFYLRSYEELETLDWLQIEGYEKEPGVLQDFQVYSLVRKIRTPGSSKVVAWDCFCKKGTPPA